MTALGLGERMMLEDAVGELSETSSSLTSPQREALLSSDSSASFTTLDSVARSISSLKYATLDCNKMQLICYGYNLVSILQLGNHIVYYNSAKSPYSFDVSLLAVLSSSPASPEIESWSIGENSFTEIKYNSIFQIITIY